MNEQWNFEQETAYTDLVQLSSVGLEPSKVSENYPRDRPWANLKVSSNASCFKDIIKTDISISEKFIFPQFQKVCLSNAQKSFQYVRGQDLLMRQKKPLHFFYFRWWFLPFRNQMECWELEKYWFTDSCWNEQPGLEKLCLFPLLLDELFLFVFHELLKIQTTIFKHLIVHLPFYFLLVQCWGPKSELSHHMFISSLKCLQGKINWCLQIGWKTIPALLPSDSALQILYSYFCILNVTTCEPHKSRELTHDQSVPCRTTPQIMQHVVPNCQSMFVCLFPKDAEKQ